MRRSIRFIAPLVASAGMIAALPEDPPLRGFTAESSKAQRE